MEKLEIISYGNLVSKWRHEAQKLNVWVRIMFWVGSYNNQSIIKWNKSITPAFIV